jgi:hypothetical protein
MRTLILSTALLLAATGARAEIIDRLAVTVDRIVITESDILSHLRIAAFLNQTTLETGADARRAAAERMVEQVLVRRDMEISRYPAPSLEEVAPVLQDVLRERSMDDAGYRAALEQFGVTDEELRESLLLQLTVLRFIEYRFRPSVALDDEEVEAYYRDQFEPAWKQRNTSPVPALDDVRTNIEDILIQEHVDVALDEWLKQAATQARIRYLQEAFE